MNEENISIVSAFFSRISQFFNEFSW
ncbi:TPA: hypothetical protein ACSCZJ_001482, partial [Campylobacter jejuni]